jgi:Domain of unknown function (DUF4166)
VLYPQLLKGDFEKLPRALREFHSRPGGGRASGTVAVRHRSGLLARILRFPASGDNIPAQLQVVSGENEEVWIRRFGGVVRKSIQSQSGGLLLEKAGTVRLFFRLLAGDGELRFESERVLLWRIPVPLRVQGRARGSESAWEFEVTVAHVGSYRGTMIPLP